MRLKITPLLVLVFLCAVHVSAQEKANISLDDFVGNWTIDKDKTYKKKSVRKSVVAYTVKISRDHETLIVYWDHTIRSGGKDLHSYYHEDLVADGKEKETGRGDTWGPWAQTVSFDGEKLKCSYNYRTDHPTEGIYLDYKTFYFSDDGEYLIIESTFRGTERYAPSQTEPRTLYFVREH